MRLRGLALPPSTTTRHHLPPTTTLRYSPRSTFPHFDDLRLSNALFLAFLHCDSVGYPGRTPTGAEPAIIATAPSQPLQTGAAELVAPAYTSLPQDSPSTSIPGERPFNIFRSWGNLSPWYSVPRGAFGIDEGVEPPAECEVKGVHVLHRHGARYPTAWGMCPFYSRSCC